MDRVKNRMARLARRTVTAGVLSLCIAAAAVVPAHACTTFCFRHDGEWIYGRNYDWRVEHGMVVVNKRGVAKQSMADSNPARWVSKYGSVTFNQYGREMPLGGINEAGLVIECMWLDHTEYPYADPRAELSELQWIQYQLDNAATVGDVIASNAVVRIGIRNSNPIHFLLCDRAGGCAVIEFLGGRMVSYRGDDLQVTALTNNTYAYSRDFLDAAGGDESSEVFVSAPHSIKRFYRAAEGVKRWNGGAGGEPVEYAFGILDGVAGDYTMFRIVYDVKEGRIYFSTKSNPAVRHIDINRFEFTCDTPVMVLDMAGGEGGDATGMFTEYTFDDNYDLIKASFSETSFLAGIPDSVLQWIAAYPERLRCVQGGE